MRVVAALLGCAVANFSALVTKLESMRDTAESEIKKANTEYATKKCGYDSTDKAKRDAIDDANERLAKNTADRDAALATNAESSSTQAQAKKDKADAEKANEDAASLRDNQKKAYDKDQEDLKTALGQLDNAITALGKLKDEDHEKMMAKSFLSIKSGGRVARAVEAALAAARVAGGLKEKVRSMMQVPSYGNQSGQVQGILQNLKDTTNATKKTSEETEASRIDTYNKFKSDKDDIIKECEAQISLLDTSISDESSKVTVAREAIKTAEQDLESETELLKTNTEKAELAAKVHDKRQKMAAAEISSLSKAIAILDSDEAFDTARHVDVAKGFLQVDEQQKEELAVATEKKDKGKIFKAVFGIIGDLKDGYKEDQVEDDDELKNCKDTRQTFKDDEAQFNTDITTAKNDISTLEGELKKTKDKLQDLANTISDTQESVRKDTEERKADFIKFTLDVTAIRGGKKLLGNAITELNKYYKEAGGDDHENSQNSEVITTIETLKKEYEENLATRIDEEADSQDTFNSVSASNRQVIRKSQNSTTEQSEIYAKQTKNKVAKEELKASLEAALKAATEKWLSRKERCDFMEDKHGERKTARKNELEGVKLAENSLKEAAAAMK